MNFPERMEVGQLAGVKTQLVKSDMFPPPSLCIRTFSFGCLGKGCPFPGGRFILRAMLVDSEDTLFWVLWNSFYNGHAASPSVACDIPVVSVMYYCKQTFYISYNTCHLQIFTLDIYTFHKFHLNNLSFLLYCTFSYAHICLNKCTLMNAFIITNSATRCKFIFKLSHW